MSRTGGSDRAGTLELRVHRSILEIPADAWNAILDDEALPFLDHRWLAALEESGSASPRWSWSPRILSLYRGDRLVAAAPCWKRGTTDGDFARDWHWAEGFERAGIPYYPKLVLGVPYTPVTGRRLLVAPGEDEPGCARALARAALDLAREERCVSVQALFASAEDRRALVEEGWEPRAGHQLHWRNAGYRDLDDFLARFDSKRRNQLRREMAAPQAQGIRIRTVKEDELRADPDRWAVTAHAMHAATVEGLAWGRTWLNKDAYRRIVSGMPDRVEYVAAERGERVIAGAFNIRYQDRLYGRYWGAVERHAFLHFNVCYYHAIRQAIDEGIRVIEGGAGGGHKAPRGFEPEATWSLHRFVDEALHEMMRSSIREESRAVEESIRAWREARPILKR